MLTPEELFPEETNNLKEQNFFMEHVCGAEIHWYFVQAVKAMQNELYIPSCLSFLNGIEASLRITMAQRNKPTEIPILSPYKVLSNVLLNESKDLGMPVELLAFKSETDFLVKLASTKPNRVDVDIVRVRNNICHGNILEFIDSELGEDMKFFTPECMRSISNELHNISKKWVIGLEEYHHGVYGV